MSEAKKKPTKEQEEQIKKIQEILSDPKFMDEEQKIALGLIKKPAKDEWKYE